jgi:hypothetical protein
MPIHFDSENQRVFVDFVGGDIAVCIGGEDDKKLDWISIEEAPFRLTPGQSLPSEMLELETLPPVLLRFQTRAALDSFIMVLAQYHDMHFGKKARI